MSHLRLALVAACALAPSAWLATPAAAALTGLVAEDGAEIRPAFDPSIKRYAIYAGGELRLSFHTVAEPSSSIAVDGRTVASGRSIRLPALPIGAHVPVSVTDAAGVTTTYELVYVPADFPRFETTILRKGVARGHLYVGINNYAAIIDNHGVPYWLRWEPRPVIDFKKQPNGRYSYAVRKVRPNRWNRETVEQVVLDRNFNEIGRYETTGLGHTDGHDFLLLRNGNRVHVAYAGTMRPVRKGAPKPHGFVEDSIVQEINPQGKVVFQWNSEMASDRTLGRPECVRLRHTVRGCRSLDGPPVIEHLGDVRYVVGAS